MFSSMHDTFTRQAPASGSIQPDPNFVVVDVETACSRVSSICQIGIVGFRDGHEIFEFETLIDPLDHFSSFNIGIHGITAAAVSGKPTFADAYPIIAGHLSGRIAAAHSFFDKGALGAACRVHAQPLIETRWIDSVRVAKRAWPQLSSHRLNRLAGYLGIPHRHHDALSDARAAGHVILRAMEETGIALEGWLGSASKSQGPAPIAATSGPLRGERVAILGAARDNALAHDLASAGARIMSTVGKSTSILVISRDQPFGRYVSLEASYRRAREMQQSGLMIEIIDEEDMRARLAVAIAA
jgi:DNA polymerase-3 subunit epsilon